MKQKYTRNNEHGLTVLELMTTIAIIAIMSATAVPNFTIWRNSYQIRSESERVQMDLLSARMTAMKSGYNIVVSFNSATNSYTILHDLNNNGAANGGESISGRTLENDVVFGFAGGAIDDPDGTSQTENVVFGGTDTISFDPRGQASLSGVLFIIHGNHLADNDNGRLRAISVVQATGAAELWEYSYGSSPPWK